MRDIIKRIAASILVSVMSLTAFPITQNMVSIAATSEAVVKISSPVIGEGNSGEAYNIDVSIEDLLSVGDTPNLSYCELEIVYDEDLTYYSKSKGIMGTPSVYDNSSSHTLIVEVSAKEAVNVDKGTLFSLKFELPESLDDKFQNDDKSFYSLSIVDYKLKDSNGKELPASMIDGGYEYKGIKIINTNIELSMESSYFPADPDELLEVPVMISNNDGDGFNSGSIAINYDSRLQVLSFDDGLLSTKINDFGDGLLVIPIANLDSIQEDGVLFTIYFQLPEDVADNVVSNTYNADTDELVNEKAVYTLSFNDSTSLNYNASPLVFSKFDAQFTARDINITPGTTPINTTPATTAVTTTRKKTTTVKTTEAKKQTLEIQPLTENSVNILSLSQVYGSPDDAGTEVTVSFFVKNNQGFASGGLLLTYDSRLTVSGVSGTGELDKNINALVFENKKIISIALATAQNIFVGSENSNKPQLINITFKLPSSVSVGDNFPVEIKEVHSWDRKIQEGESGYREGFTKMTELTVSVSNGFIQIEKDKDTAISKNSEVKDRDNINSSTTSTKLMLGDANNNNVVDSVDAVLILQEYAKSIVDSNYKSVLLYNADVNFDGQYDAKDSVYVLQYYAHCIVGDYDNTDPVKNQMYDFMKTLGYEP